MSFLAKTSAGQKSLLCTDGAPCFPRLAKECGALRQFVNFSAGEFVRPERYLRKRMYHWQHMGSSEFLHAQQLAKYVQGHTHVYSYAALAPLALKSACFIAGFDRQSFVEQTRQVRQSKQNKLFPFGRPKPTRNTNFPKNRRKPMYF